MASQTAILQDGAALAYDVFDFTDPWTTPPEIVLVHGLSKNRKFWYRWIPDLARSFKVFSLDQRGHGESEIPSPEASVTAFTFSDDLNGFMEAVGLGSANLVMAEFSSAVALDFAVRYANRVKSLILPGFGYDFRHSPIDLSAWSRLAREQGSGAWAEETNRYRLREGADPGLRRWYIDQQSRMPGWFLAKVFDACAGIDLTDNLPRVSAPTLVIAGTESHQAPIETVRKGVAAMPRARLEVIEDAPFNVMTDSPDECLQATKAFLDGPATGSASP